MIADGLILGFFLTVVWLCSVFLRRGTRGPSEYQKLRDAGRRARGGGS